jgi:uncharacterized protein
VKLSRHAPTDRQVVQRYGNGGFRVSGVDFTGSVIILPDGTKPWPLASVDDLSIEAFSSVLEVASSLDVFLLGCGTQMQLLNQDLRKFLRDGGLAVDTMETGAACRSYSVLVTEGRSVAAALIAI